MNIVTIMAKDVKESVYHNTCLWDLMVGPASEAVHNLRKR